MGIGIAIKGAAAALSSSNTYKLQCAKLCNIRKIWTISKLTYKPILKKICEIPARITPPSSLSLLCFIPTKRYFGMACASSAHSFGPFFSGIGSRDQSQSLTLLIVESEPSSSKPQTDEQSMYTYMKEQKKIGITFFLCISFCARLFLKVLLIPLI